MADVKISELPVATSVSATDVGPIVHAGITVKATGAQVVTSALNATPVTSTQGGTGQSTYTLGDTLYASATNTLSKLAGNIATTKKFLSQTGLGATSTAPSWEVLDPSDINTQYGSFYFDYSTTVSSTVGQNDTTINVVSTTGFSNAGAIFIGAELVTYTGITATSFTGCTRGQAGSNSASHAVGVPVNGAQVASANTATLLQYNTTTLTNGVTLNTATQEISVAVGGTYNFAFSLQLNNSAGGQTRVAVWFEVDGVKLSNSASWGTVASRENATTPASTIMAANFFITLTSSNKVTMKWLTTGTGAIVTYPASASPNYPAAPAAVLTVNQVS